MKSLVYLRLEVSVVVLKMFFAWLAQFHCHEFEAALLESLDDFTNESALDTVGFDSDKGTFVGHGSLWRKKVLWFQSGSYRGFQMQISQLFEVDYKKYPKVKCLIPKNPGIHLKYLVNLKLEVKNLNLRLVFDLSQIYFELLKLQNNSSYCDLIIQKYEFIIIKFCHSSHTKTLLFKSKAFSYQIWH